MIKKAFITSDGKQHSSASRAARHDQQRALREFIEINLKPDLYWDEDRNPKGDLVRLADVMAMVLNNHERLTEFALAHRAAHLTRDFTYEEVEDFVILAMAKHAMLSSLQPYSTHYIRTTIEKVWDVLVESATADGGYSDLQCELSYQAKKHFLED